MMRRSGATLGRDRRGSVAIEGALAVTVVLLPLVFGVLATGQMLATQLRLDRALQAAWLYALAVPGAATTAISDAGRAGYGAGGAVLTPVATRACYCMASTGTRASAGAAVACTGTTCTGGTTLATFLTASMTATVTVNVPLPTNLRTRTIVVGGTFRLS